MGTSQADLVEKAAAVLWSAGRTCTPVPPIRNLLGTSTDIDIGYAVQQVNTERWIREGRRISGRKIGVTSKAVQEQIGVAQPDFGTLFVDTEYSDGVEIPASRLIQPRVEAEVALIVGQGLDNAPHGFAEIIRSIDFALPAIEVVDSRIEDWQISIVDTVSDNASCGLYVLGSKPVPLTRLNLRTLPMRMSINGGDVSTGIGAACLGNPIHAARWLADTLCERGIPLCAGDVLMTGALGPMKPISVGDEVVALLGDLGEVTTRLTDC